jgi:ryanodine receptor 2
MLESGNYQYKTEKYVRNGLYFAYLSAPWVLRRFLVIPGSRVLGLYCACYDTLTYPPVFTNFMLIVSVLVGMDKAYWFTFTLLDVVTMSPLLRATLTSVTRPIDQLMQTFSLFVIVICCYTAVAFFLFGNTHFINGDDDDAPQACDTLIECFVFSLYVGIREGDMDAVLDDADMDDRAQWRNRIIYDLTFFIILGVLLFDVVTGIILDTFGELREEVNDRKDKMENETFISGIGRDKIEELPQEIEFSVINENDQNVWNYLFFIIYVKNKDPGELNGIESFVKECLENEDTSWFPQKTSWRIEYTNATMEDERAPEEIIEEQVDRLVGLEETMKGMIRAIGASSGE